MPAAVAAVVAAETGPESMARVVPDWALKQAEDYAAVTDGTGGPAIHESMTGVLDESIV